VTRDDGNLPLRQLQLAALSELRVYQPQAFKFRHWQPEFDHLPVDF
jgi:hypothetical protein